MIDFILQHLPWFWLILVVVFVIIEASTLTLVTIWFATAALLMAFLSFAKIPFLVQILLFLIISAVLLFLFRKAALEWFSKHGEKTNVDAIIGKEALVISDITKFEKGKIKVMGQIWTAKTQNDTDIPANSICIIQSIEGVTAIVIPKTSE
ncbi:MAG: NfeD family protein [Treponema sp.]|jgi:membrane protein implicated in regulation of membrane protease activity|nr:NfeD family protein [Treponema sp.]